jgi:ADP-ribose pyrophosphatase YjhB (NUDIX family)
MSKEWLTDEEWHLVEGRMPIACVDVLPLRNAEGSPQEVGLIWRPAPVDQHWCLIGGRILRNESVEEAQQRLLTDSLGPHIRWRSRTNEQPIYVAQYFPHKRAGYPRDPRKHAVALTYVVDLDGRIEPSGEAAGGFRWFASDSLSSVDFGFEQGLVVERCLAALRDL